MNQQNHSMKIPEQEHQFLKDPKDKWDVGKRDNSTRLNSAGTRPH